MNPGDIIFEDDYMVVRKQHGDTVAVAVGQDPKTATPTIVEAEELRDSLDEFLGDKHSFLKTNSMKETSA